MPSNLCNMQENIGCIFSEYKPNASAEHHPPRTSKEAGALWEIQRVTALSNTGL